jgi:RNA polymerase sigma-70 factor (ECF subfamily)
MSTPVPHSRPDDPRGSAGSLENLLQRVAGGDEVALTEFYGATKRRVYGLALQMLRDPQRAEEATLDVYTTVWRKADRYRSVRGSAVAWLLATTRNLVLDALRADGRRTLDRGDVAAMADDLRAADEGPVEAGNLAERAAAVRRAAAGLPRGQREAIAACYFGGLTHVEAAATLGVPLGTVKTRIRAGLSRLERCLSGSEDLLQ